MLIHSLSGASPRPWSADLHPRLTVVHGVPEEVSSSLRAALDALVRARISGPELAAAGIGGQVVVGGVEIPVEELAERAPGLVPSTPLSYADLVGPPTTIGNGRGQAVDDELAAARSLVARAEEELNAARDAWTSRRVARAGRVAEGLRARSQAAAALRTSRRRVVDAAVVTAAPQSSGSASPADDDALRALAFARLDAARAAHQAAADADAEAKELHDGAQAVADGSGRDLDELRAELDAAERDLVGMVEPAVSTPEERRGAVDRRTAIVAELAQIETKPTDRVRAALEAADHHGGIAAVEAAQVAVEWERVRDLVVDDQVGPPPDAGVDTPTPAPPLSAETANRLQIANDRVTATRRGVAEATSSVGLDGSEVEALEAAHAEVLEAWEGSERRIGVGKARRRLEDAQFAEREILSRLGFASYTEFMMSGRTVGMPSTLDVDHARRAQAEAEAQLAVVEAEAEAELASVPAPPAFDADAARGRLAATLTALSARAADLLGQDPGEDVAASLRQRIATDPVSDLRLALDDVGLQLGEVLARDEVMTRARAWVAQQDGAVERRSALTAERIDVEDHLARLDAADGARVARRAATRRRDERRNEVEARTAARGALEAAATRMAHDHADLGQAAADEAEAEAALAALETADPHQGEQREPVEAVDVDLPTLEAEARDAQTALDVAVSHLLPARSDDEGESTDAALGRAAARLEVARIELAGIESAHTERAATGFADGEPADPDALIWQILARMAAQREAAVPAGPGPAPLVLDNPFGPLDGADVVRVCEAVVGPASAVQVIVITSHPDAVAWLAGVDPAAAGGVSAHLLDAITPS